MYSQDYGKRGSHPEGLMRQKQESHESFFPMGRSIARPDSVATEFVDTDWEGEEDAPVEDDDLISYIEDDEVTNSPHASLHSSGQPSFTTLSSYEEAQTPRSSRIREMFPVEYDFSRPSVEGPRGPHLFRSSTASGEYDHALSMSPLTPKPRMSPGAEITFHLHHEPLPLARPRDGPFRFTDRELDIIQLADWTPEMVAQWMVEVGVELPLATKFVENDINGPIIMTLKPEDLKELQISSFGMRTRLWSQICRLRDEQNESPLAETPIQDEEDKEVARERAHLHQAHDEKRLKKSLSKKAKLRPDDIISPLESVSIVGIEQVMPKPCTKCSKGENCKHNRRRDRMINMFKEEHPVVDDGGMIMIAGDPGNPLTARALNRQSTEALRPFSDAIPSVVASSDVLGPGSVVGPMQHLQESILRQVLKQDPQDNVQQFLDFQHQQIPSGSTEVPPTPPFELYSVSSTPAPHERLRDLPKLSIPGQSSSSLGRRASQDSQNSQMSQGSQGSNSQQFFPHRMSKHSPLADELHSALPSAAPTVVPYRFGTPFSDMDVPTTAIQLGPVSRDTSQSVPPDMGFRAPSVPVRSMSRASKRPSFHVMASLDENAATSVTSLTKPTPSIGSSADSFQSPKKAPPRSQWPWQRPEEVVKDAEGVTYAGPVRKRKTKLLRHEWNDQFATLKGTRLALHKDEISRDLALEYIDIDDYAIACSALASSKLNAAFKAMAITSGGNKKDDKVAAFSFDLIPQSKESLSSRLRNRYDSGTPSSGSAVAAVATADPALKAAANGTGKAHHFAVRSRDERIDWMRELMLAKALKQKGGEGFQISVNGNMI